MIDDRAQQKILEAYEKTILNEVTSNIKDVAHDMARLIMGDKDIALKSLNKSLPLEQATFQPGPEYNKAFTQLFKDIESAIIKALRAAK